MHLSNSGRSKLLSLKSLREMLLLFTMIHKGTISANFVGYRRWKDGLFVVGAYSPSVRGGGGGVWHT